MNENRLGISIKTKSDCQMFLVSFSLPFSHWQDLIHVLSIPIPIHLPSNRKTKHRIAIVPLPLYSSSSFFCFRLPAKVIDSRVRAFDRESSSTSSISVEKVKPKQKTTCNSCGKVGNKLNCGRGRGGMKSGLHLREAEEIIILCRSVFLQSRTIALYIYDCSSTNHLCLIIFLL